MLTGNKSAPVKLKKINKEARGKLKTQLFSTQRTNEMTHLVDENCLAGCLFRLADVKKCEHVTDLDKKAL